MREDFQEEVVAPAGAQDFVVGRHLGGMGLKQVEGGLAQDGEVLGPVAEDGAGLVLAEGDVEAPMQVVLDAPVGAHDAAQALGGDEAGEDEVFELGLSGQLGVAAPGFDARDSAQAGEAVRVGKVRGAHDADAAAPNWGVGILPKVALPPVHKLRIQALPISNPMLARSVGIISLRGYSFSPAARELTKAVQKRLRIRDPESINHRWY